jgi:peptide/nickel transport system permease protein
MRDELVGKRAASVEKARRLSAASAWMRANPMIVLGGILLVGLAFAGLLAPWLASQDPVAIDPAIRNKLPGFTHMVQLESGGEAEVTNWLGTDTLGRDILARILYGIRISLVVGLSVSLASVAIGLVIGLASGYVRWLDGIVMRIMDGLMAIPPILLAMAIVTLFRPGLFSVILAITVPEIPRVVRLVRSVVLSAREQPYVQAAVSLGTRPHLIVLRHILPSTVAPLIVLATFICASAMLIEAVLSFIGIGIPPEIPTLGNIMADGRLLFRLYPGKIFFAAIVLALAVLAVNMLGDGLRDKIDHKARER